MNTQNCDNCANTKFQSGVGGPCANCIQSGEEKPTNWKPVETLNKPLSLAEERALARQVGGSHYKDMKIQPAEFIHANGIGFCEGSVIKYVSRWRRKGGIDDLHKARHFIDLLIELEGATPGAAGTAQLVK